MAAGDSFASSGPWSRGVREIGWAIRGDKEVLGRFRAELEDRLRWERVSLGKEHSEAVRGIENKAGEFYRAGLEGSEKRARELKKIKLAWKDLHYMTAPGVLILWPSIPVIAPLDQGQLGR